nr:helix-turn-helix transcriptional regulator [Stenotrophomonas acidaminiphila]
MRLEHGAMTQQALADACAVTRQTIIALEAGRYAPSLELAFRIARAFGVGVEDVFRWEG